MIFIRRRIEVTPRRLGDWVAVVTAPYLQTGESSKGDEGAPFPNVEESSNAIQAFTDRIRRLKSE
jgi:hypothetical protein